MAAALVLETNVPVACRFDSYHRHQLFFPDTAAHSHVMSSRCVGCEADISTYPIRRLHGWKNFFIMFDLDTNQLLKCDGPNCGRTDETAMRRSVDGFTRILCQRCVSIMYPKSHGWMKLPFTFAGPVELVPGKKTFGTFKPR
jgi:hypothetical protein